MAGSMFFSTMAESFNRISEIRPMSFVYKNMREKSHYLLMAEWLTSIHGTFYVFMIEIYLPPLDSARGGGYGWNIHTSKLRISYSVATARVRRDRPRSSPGPARRWLCRSYLFMLCDSSKQCRRTMVAGNDLAVRGNSRTRATHRKSHVLDSRGSLAVMGSSDQHGHCDRWIWSEHLLFKPCFSSRWQAAGSWRTCQQLGGTAQRI